jgi:drug/metabolite transporter (DMT)-like permease
MSMVAYLFPLGGVILGVAFLNEPLTWQLAAGAALIIASLAIANWQQPAKSPAQHRAALATQETGCPGD